MTNEDIKEIFDQYGLMIDPLQCKNKDLLDFCADISDRFNTEISVNILEHQIKQANKKQIIDRTALLENKVEEKNEEIAKLKNIQLVKHTNKSKKYIKLCEDIQRQLTRWKKDDVIFKGYKLEEILITDGMSGEELKQKAERYEDTRAAGNVITHKFITDVENILKANK